LIRASIFAAHDSKDGWPGLRPAMTAIEFGLCQLFPRKIASTGDDGKTSAAKNADRAVSIDISI